MERQHHLLDFDNGPNIDGVVKNITDDRRLINAKSSFSIVKGKCDLVQGLADLNCAQSDVGHSIGMQTGR